MLFKAKEDITEHISVNVNFRLSEVKPSILQAERKFIVPAIGKEFLKEIDTIYNGTDPVDPIVQELIKLLQAALAHYSFFIYQPINQVQIGANGVTEAGGQGVSPVRQWAVSDLKKSLLDSGDIFLDAAIEYLEDNQEEEVFETWKESRYFSQSKELIINTAEELSLFVNIQNSRRTFLALKPFLTSAETLFVRSNIGEEQYNELKTEIKERAVTPDNQILIDLLKPAVSKLAVFKAIPEIMLKVTSEGIKVDSFNNGINKKDPASDNQIGALYRSLEQDGNALLVLAKEHLIKNADDYPTFKASKAYTDTLSPEEGGACKFDWSNLRGYGV